MTKAKETRHTARTEILHYVLSFCVSHKYSSGQALPGTVSFQSAEVAGQGVIVGDLVIVKSAPATKWTIGWVREMRETQPGWPEYLIESLEDGALCWWGNIGLDYFPRDKLADFPHWRWTDRQWAFKRRWWSVCYKDRDAYIVRPLWPEFGEGFAVTIGTRTSHGFDDIRPTRTFPDWRKVTKAQMATCYDDCVAERDRLNAERKAQRELAEQAA